MYGEQSWLPGLRQIVQGRAQHSGTPRPYWGSMSVASLESHASGTISGVLGRVLIGSCHDLEFTGQVPEKMFKWRHLLSGALLPGHLIVGYQWKTTHRFLTHCYSLQSLLRWVCRGIRRSSKRCWYSATKLAGMRLFWGKLVMVRCPAWVLIFRCSWKG